MITIETRAHVGPDGTLAVQVPAALCEKDFEVLLVLQPVAEAQVGTNELGWPKDFFEKTFGSFSDEPLERFPQGEAEEREPLL